MGWPCSRWIGPCGAQVEKGWEGIKNGERQKQTCVNNYLSELLLQ